MVSTLLVAIRSARHSFSEAFSCVVASLRSFNSAAFREFRREGIGLLRAQPTFCHILRGEADDVVMGLEDRKSVV